MEFFLGEYYLKCGLIVCVLSLTVSCGGGDSSSSEEQNENIGPSANAGIDVTVNELSEVAVDGGASTDVDGSIVLYQWRQLEGPSIDIRDSTSSSFSFVAPEATASIELVFELSVTDDDSLLDTDLVTVKIQPVNVVPVANAGEDSVVDEQSLVSLSGEGSDADGEIFEYLWRQVSGPTVELSEDTSPSIQFQAPATTSTVALEFELHVTDNEGERSSDNVAISVLPVNLAPTANAGEDTAVDEQSLVSLSGEGNDADGEISEYLWRQVSGPTVELSEDTSPSTQFQAPATTSTVTLEFELHVTDNEGERSSDNVAISLLPVNLAPTANAGEDRAVDEQSLVSLSGEGSDADGEISEYLWRQVSGPTVVLSEDTSPIIQFQAPLTTSTVALEFELLVTDNEGERSIDSVTITVLPVNADPVANVGDDIVVNEQTEVALWGDASSDSDGTIVQYRWRQLAGPLISLEDRQAVNTSFFANATITEVHYVFELTVVDNERASAQDEITVTILPVNAAPIVEVSEDLVVDEESSFALEGIASDSDGEIMRYHWVQTSGPLWPISDRSATRVELVAPDVQDATEYSFELFVVDNEGAERSDEVVVTVEPAFQVKTIFPPKDTAFFGVEIELTGRAENYEGPASDVTITVESGSSVLEPSIDENGFWRLSNVPIESTEGIAFVNVSAIDQAGNESTYQIKIDTQPTIIDAKKLIHDDQRNKLYTYSNQQRAFVSIDIDTGLREVLSSPDIGTGSAFPSWMKDVGSYFDSENSANSRLYMLGIYSLVEVDITTGNRRYLPFGFSSADALATDEIGNEVFVVENDRVLGLSTSSDTSRVIASVEVGDGPLISAAESMDFDPQTNALYVIDSSLHALVKININTLERTIVIDDANEQGLSFLRTEYETYMDSQNAELYVYEFGSVHKINVTDGSVSSFSASLDNMLDEINAPTSLALNRSESGMYFNFSGRQRIISYLSATEQIENVLTVSYGSGDPYKGGYEMVFDTETERLILSHASYGGDSQSPSFSFISPSSGDRHSFAWNVPNQVLDFIPVGNTFVYRSGSGLYRYDVYTDEDTVISSLLRGDGPSFSGGYGVGTNSAENVSYLFGQDQILEIDMTSGDREIVFEYPSDTSYISYSYEGSTNLIYGYTDENNSELFSIDTQDWQRNVVTQIGTTRPEDIHILNNGKTYTINGGGFYSQPSLTNFNRNTFEETLVSDFQNGSGQVFIHPTQLQIDEINERAFISASGQLFVVDLVSGDRAVLAQ